MIQFNEKYYFQNYLKIECLPNGKNFNKIMQSEIRIWFVRHLLFLCFFLMSCHHIPIEIFHIDMRLIAKNKPLLPSNYNTYV